MTEFLMNSHPEKTGLAQIQSRETKPGGLSGSVAPDRLAVFEQLEGQMVRCLAGDLWVTIENDTEDYVLEHGQSVYVPTPGKVIIGGRGRYLI